MKLRSSNAKSPPKAAADRVVKDIRRQTRRHFLAEDNIRIVLEGLRGDDRIPELCRKEDSEQETRNRSRYISDCSQCITSFATVKAPRVLRSHSHTTRVRHPAEARPSRLR